MHVPDEAGAEERAWRIVRAAFAEREPARRRTRLVRPALALAAALALLAGALSAPGRAVLGSIRKQVVGERRAAPALFSLPAEGQLLVDSRVGPWIVQPDGSKRLLGRYAEASWSAYCRYVAVARGRELTAVDRKGNVRWSLARRGPVRDARWAPDGFRIAYRSGPSLRVVIGNGLGDRRLVAHVAPVPPAWRPGNRHVLAFVDPSGRVVVYDTDSRVRLWRSRSVEAPGQLLWSADGARLLAVRKRGIAVFDERGRRLGALGLPGLAGPAAFAPRGHRFALVRVRRERSEAVVLDADALRSPARRIFSGAGRFTGVQWSPDGRWILLGWSSADQWLFVRSAGVQRIRAVSDVSNQFHSRAGFPGLAGWCRSASR